LAMDVNASVAMAAVTERGVARISFRGEGCSYGGREK